VDAIRVTVTRGDVVEAVHVVHAAATDGDGWGDPRLAFQLRSAAKPIQAIPFVDG
jgi:L-asparaginase II